MGLLDASYSAVNTKKPRKSDRILPATELNARGLLDAATNVPIAGDALSGVLAAYDAAKGDYGSAAVNALGVLPFLSAGMIKAKTPFTFIRNTAKSPNMGETFGQHIEPAGRYMLEDTSNVASKLPEGWISGKHTFNNPLMIDWGKGGYADADNWKNVLSEKYGGKKGKQLSKAITKDGYDGIVTLRDGETSEVVDLSSFIKQPAKSGLLDDVRPMTEYEKRHEIARQNAVKMLGLPENNTAMDRARAMGFDTPAYHGTNADVPEFDMSLVGSSTVLPFGAPKGAYFAKEQSVAGRYARGSDSGANVMPVMLNKDGALLDNSKIVVTDKPENIRSRFAAFDPARRNEADILGYADPRLLGLIGGGGLLGLGAYKANQE